MLHCVRHQVSIHYLNTYDPSAASVAYVYFPVLRKVPDRLLYYGWSKMSFEKFKVDVEISTVWRKV